LSDIQEIDEIVPLTSAQAASAPPAEFATPVRGIQPGDLTAAQPASQEPGEPYSRSQPRSSKGILGTLGAIGIVLAKWWGVALTVLLKLKSILLVGKVLLAGKLLLTGGTMLLSMFLWSYRFGWPMAIGIVLSIFIHECGHALAAKSLGHKLGIMVFIPFMGAFVTARGGRNATEDAFVGIMGPVAGTLTAIACVGLFTVTGAPFWLALATLGFFINLINLAPSRPLDGGWIAPLISPKIILPGMVLGVIAFHSNAFFWVLAIMAIPNAIHAWRHGNESPYYKASTRDRWIYGISYAGLIVFLTTALFTTSSYMTAQFRHSTVRRTAAKPHNHTQI